MKRTNAKKLSIFLLFILVTACAVTGCTPSFDASTYIKACLDANTHGEFASKSGSSKQSIHYGMS